MFLEERVAEDERWRREVQGEFVNEEGGGEERRGVHTQRVEKQCATVEDPQALIVFTLLLGVWAFMCGTLVLCLWCS